MNHSIPDSRKHKKHRIGIKWKMYGILILFIGIVVGVIWFFQIQLLNYYFQVTKFKELELSAQAISAELMHPDKLDSVAEKYASEFQTDIWIYHIDENKKADPILEASGSGSPDIAFLPQKIEKLYDKAVENEELYIALVFEEQFCTDYELKILQDNENDTSAYPIIANHTADINAICISIRQTPTAQYMIVQRTNMTPISAVVKTLQNQSITIALILSILALIMAALMSKLITKPIVKMNAAAKQLAQGHYNVNFLGDGYREIDELADTLNYASYELAKSDKLQKELISNISHDLRTPLTMIKGYSEVMRDIPGENTPENIQIIIDETSRLSELVNDMLDLSKIQAGTRKPDFQPFSLTETVRDTMRRYERLTMQDGYQIEFEADGDAQVIADRGMILQVIYNLINNAINYTGEDKHVLVKQVMTENTVRISVTDTGEGIAEEQLPLIWDRYYKVDKVHRRATVGTGLGLSIVKGILELHHAFYGVQSTVGVGSTFWFELQIAPPPQTTDYLEADYENPKETE